MRAYKYLRQGQEIFRLIYLLLTVTRPKAMVTYRTASWLVPRCYGYKIPTGLASQPEGPATSNSASAIQFPVGKEASFSPKLVCLEFAGARIGFSGGRLYGTWIGEPYTKMASCQRMSLTENRVRINSH